MNDVLLLIPIIGVGGAIVALAALLLIDDRLAELLRSGIVGATVRFLIELRRTVRQMQVERPSGRLGPNDAIVVRVPERTLRTLTKSGNIGSPAGARPVVVATESHREAAGWEETQDLPAIPLTPAPGSPVAKTFPGLVVDRACIVGSSRHADRRITAPTVSRRHCHIAPASAGSALVVCDLGSRNGTYVNGKQVHGPVVVASGSLVSLGRATAMIVTRGGTGE